MDCDFENLLICKRKLKKNGVTYRTVMESPSRARRLRNSDGRYVRVVRPDTTTMIERNPSWTYDESGTVIATESLTVHERIYHV
jgi:hypothetical protein